MPLRDTILERDHLGVRLAGDDVLDGGKGADTLDGGEGDDTYFVDDPLDTVVELADGVTVDEVKAKTKAKLTAQGMEPAFSSGAAASELIQRELPTMRAVAARSNITAD